jgi:hypothetical protein
MSNLKYIIPKGYRKLEIGEMIEEGDMYFAITSPNELYRSNDVGLIMDKEPTNIVRLRKLKPGEVYHGESSYFFKRQ